MREFYRRSGLSRFALFSLAGAGAFLVVAVILVQRVDGLADDPTTASTDSATTDEAPSASDEAPGRTIPYGSSLGSPEDEVSEREAPESRSRASASNDTPSPADRQGESPEPEARQESPEPPGGSSQGSQGQPIQNDDWPGADRQEVEEAKESRDYGWTQGATMTLSSSALGISDAPVFGNDSQRSLNRGVAHVPQTSLPWDRGKQKNVFLAAHRLGWPDTGSRLLFYNLDQLQNGDEVSLKRRGGENYRYEVTEKMVVDPEDRWVMGEVRGEDMLTLQTCTPSPTFHKRLIVRAEKI